MDVLLPHSTGPDRLILAVDPDPVRLAQVGDELVTRTGWPLLSVGAALVEALCDIPEDRRPLRVRTVLSAAIRAAQPDAAGTLFLADLSPLFDPALSVDALDLLQRCARDCRLIALWPGSLSDSTLCFAVPQHAHYRCWPRPTAGAITLR